MAKGPKALVEPALLVWARNSAGLSIDAACKNITSPGRLALWEDEDSEMAPSVRQLTQLANKYKRPLSVFYLPEPPKDFAALQDFRRLPGEIAGLYSPNLIYEIRIAQERREIALELYQDLGEPVDPFGLKADRRKHPETLGQEIRAFLGVSYEEQIGWRDARKAYNAWRDHIEAAGVLVFQASRIDMKEMRGFAIAEQQLPVIAVNSKDHVNGRTFSLLHELCHVVLGQSALTDYSAFTEDETGPAETQTIEDYCDQVAAAVLMPEKSFLQERLVTNHGSSTVWEDNELDALARQYGVSPEATLRRLLTFGKTSQRFYRQKRRDFLARYAELAEKQKGKTIIVMPDKRALGNLGASFSRLVLQNYYSNRITLNDVSGYLGVQVKYVSSLESAVHGRAM